MITILVPTTVDEVVCRELLSERGWLFHSFEAVKARALADHMDVQVLIRKESDRNVVVGSSAESFRTEGVPVDVYVRPLTGRTLQNVLDVKGRTAEAMRKSAFEWAEFLSEQARVAEPFCTINLLLPMSIEDGVLAAAQTFTGSVSGLSLPRESKFS